MSDRIRLRSVAALAASLTMVGVGIHGLTQDSGAGPTVDLASSVGSHTPTAASPDAAGDGEARSPAFVEAPTAGAAPAVPPDDPPGTPRRVRPGADLATPVVTVKPGPHQRPDFAGEPPTECLGFVFNNDVSAIPIGAELWDEERSIPVAPGKAVAGTPGDLIGGFHIRQGGLHLTIDYYEVGGGYVATHDVDVAAARYYDVRPCHEAYVTVSYPEAEQGTDGRPVAAAPDAPATPQAGPATNLLDVDPVPDAPATPDPDTAAVQPNFPIGQG